MPHMTTSFELRHLAPAPLPITDPGTAAGTGRIAHIAEAGAAIGGQGPAWSSSRARTMTIPYQGMSIFA